MAETSQTRCLLLSLGLARLGYSWGAGDASAEVGSLQTDSWQFAVLIRASQL